MNGVCGSGTASSLVDPPQRGNMTSSVSPINKRAVLIAGIGSGSVNVSGCNLPTAAFGPDSNIRKSRSQGGKILQKCLSTASYGEDMSMAFRFHSTPPASCHSLLLTRQYCSFGSTTSFLKLLCNYNFFCFTFYFSLPWSSLSQSLFHFIF